MLSQAQRDFDKIVCYSLNLKTKIDDLENKCDQIHKLWRMEVEVRQRATDRLGKIAKALEQNDIESIKKLVQGAPDYL